MKFLVVFGVILAVLVSEARFIGDSSEESPDVAEALICIAGQGLIDYSDTIADIMTKDKYPIDDEKFNKFFGCYWKNKGIMDEDNNLNHENFKTFLQNLFADGGKVTGMHKLFAQNILDECKDTKGQSPGQKAVKIQNCVLAYLSQFDDSS